MLRKKFTQILIYKLNSFAEEFVQRVLRTLHAPDHTV